MNKLRLSQTAFPIHTLGPFRRFGIWVQGCDKRCPGCISPETQSMSGGYEVDISTLTSIILEQQGIEGLTISGGEPFLQNEALHELIQLLRNKKDLGVIMYTGYQLGDVADSLLIRDIDVLIDGEYREELNDGCGLRGSSNQQIHFLTERYKETLFLNSLFRKTELLHTLEGGLSLVGIPGKRDFVLMRKLKQFLGRN